MQHHRTAQRVGQPVIPRPLQQALAFVLLVATALLLSGCVDVYDQRDALKPFLPYMEEYRTAGSATNVEGEPYLRGKAVVLRADEVKPADGETAERWRYLDGGGELGVISSVTQAFCRDCNRARLSTEGKLFLCLFASRGHDLRALLRGGCSDEQIAAAIGLIWSEREDRYSELRGAGTAAAGSGERRVEMHYIGG